VRAALKVKYLDLTKDTFFVNANRTSLKLLSYFILYRTLKEASFTNYYYKKKPNFNCSYTIKRLKFVK
jgi:hypothetical protein